MYLESLNPKEIAELLTEELSINNGLTEETETQVLPPKLQQTLLSLLERQPKTEPKLPPDQEIELIENGTKPIAWIQEDQLMDVYPWPDEEAPFDRNKEMIETPGKAIAINLKEERGYLVLLPINMEAYYLARWVLDNLAPENSALYHVALGLCFGYPPRDIIEFIEKDIHLSIEDRLREILEN